MVAGGIGISPFLAILSDILHRINDGLPSLPKNVLLVWAIKNSDELPLLHTVDMEGICPLFSDKLNLEIKTYITRETEPPLEEGIVSSKAVSPCACVFPSLTGRRMSGLVGTGHVAWSGLYLVASTIGFVISVFLLNVLYINPFNITSWWYKGLLFMGCMAAGVVIFGGFVICVWQLWERKTSSKQDFNAAAAAAHNLGIKPAGMDKISGQQQYVSTIRYGQRPDFGGTLRYVMLISISLWNFFCVWLMCFSPSICRNIWKHVGAVGECGHRRHRLRPSAPADQCCKTMQITELEEKK